MGVAVELHRKLIDIKPAVFESLSLEAERRGISLKRHIENILEEACPRKKVGGTSGISCLIGSALPSGADIDSLSDDRIQYLLSK
jgi:hypothetical protein